MERIKMVGCRGLKYTPAVPLEECLKCDHNSGHKVLSGGSPEREEVICVAPVTVRVGHFVKGADKGSTD